MKICKNPISPLFAAIYKEVQKIPPGQTKTYGQIAKAVHTHPRVVGMALHRNPSPDTIPCHRVVFKDGSCSLSFAFGGESAQKELLDKEKQHQKNLTTD